MYRGYACEVYLKWCCINSVMNIIIFTACPLKKSAAMLDVKFSNCFLPFFYWTTSKFDDQHDKIGCMKFIIFFRINIWIYFTCISSINESWSCTLLIMTTFKWGKHWVRGFPPFLSSHAPLEEVGKILLWNIQLLIHYFWQK